MPGAPDFWWEIGSFDSLNNIRDSIIEAVRNIVLPEINKRLADEGLIDSWINGSFAGTTELGRFKYLTVLLKAKGDFNTLNQVVDAFMDLSKGRPNAGLALTHLKEIGYDS